MKYALGSVAIPHTNTLESNNMDTKHIHRTYLSVAFLSAQPDTHRLYD